MAVPRGVMLHIFIFIIYSSYNIYISLPIIGRQLLTLTSVTCYKRDRFLNLLRVGLIPLFSGKIDRWIKARDASRVDTVDARTTRSPINARALKST